MDEHLAWLLTEGGVDLASIPPHWDSASTYAISRYHQGVQLCVLDKGKPRTLVLPDPQYSDDVLLSILEYRHPTIAVNGHLPHSSETDWWLWIMLTTSFVVWWFK